MSFIDGIGDEVVLFFAALVLVAIVMLAWNSTRVLPFLHHGPVWMVHIQSNAEAHVLEVYSLSDTQDAAVRTSESAIPAESHSLEERVDEIRTELSSQLESECIIEDLQQPSEVVEELATPTTSAEGQQDSPAQAEVDDNEAVSTAFDEPASISGLRQRVPTTTIKLKFWDDTQKLVRALLYQTVGEFKRQHFETDVSEGKVVRLIYQGQLLRDDSRSLESYGLHENCVLHCLISRTPYETAQSDNRTTVGNAVIADSITPQQGLDLGRYVYLIAALNFAALWSIWFMFPEYFSLTSLLSLFFCSGVFMLFWYGSQRHRTSVNSSGSSSSITATTVNARR